MLKCKICYHWQNEEIGNLRPNLEDWKKFIGSLAKEVAPDFTIVFGGGEPLLYPDELVELVSFSSGLGFRTALTTSGHTITEGYAERLANSGLNNIDLTIFSLNNEIHDFLRGVDGSLMKVLNTINYFGRFSDTIRIGINTIIMKPTLADLIGLTEWVNSDPRLHGICYQAIMRPFHTPFVDEWYKVDKYRFLWPDDLIKLESVIDTLISMKQKNYRIGNPVSQFATFKLFFKNPSTFIKAITCNLTNGKFFTVNSDGSVALCPYMESLGKITDGDFRQLWYSQHASSIKEKIGQCQINCHHLINCWYEEE
jgi:MoaA/NifB/PqqE/SkfB family radical SAM enzyme